MACRRRYQGGLLMQARSAKLTIEATPTVINGRPQLTVRVTLLDQTIVAYLTGTATLIADEANPKHLDDSLRCIALQAILDKCEDLGWRRLPVAERESLASWNEHSVIAHVLRSLLDGIEQNDRKRAEDSARDRERPVVVVDRQEQPRLDPFRDIIGRGSVLQPPSNGVHG